VTQRRVRPFGVVIDPPRLDALARIGQREEPAGIETLSPDTGVEGFDESIVGWRSWPGEVQLNTVQIGPLVKQASGELWTVVDPNALRLAPFEDEMLEHLERHGRPGNWLSEPLRGPLASSNP
jgi:hypothetical protein